jgi:hypothetical protein
MYIYRCTKRFLCTPLDRYIPVGAHIARYENAVRIVVDEAPRSDQDPFNVLVDGISYTDPARVTWLYGVEPAPLGSNNREWFEVIGVKDEDAYGNVSGTTGLPENSELQIDPTGKVYLKSVTNGLFYQFQMSGVNGSAVIQVGQTGIVL